MTNQEAAKTLKEFTTKKHGLFAWPLDCDHEQHMKFISYRNRNWSGGSEEDWKQFILDYADSLLINAARPDSFSEGDGQFEESAPVNPHVREKP